MEGTDDSFWVQLAQEAYFKGAGRAFDDTEVLKRRENLLEPDKPLAGLGITREQFLRESFAHPVSVDRIKVLASRVLTELNGVTSGMDASLSRVLVDGLTQGKSPYTVAREITKEVGGIEKKRAKVIARTETIRAHAEGQLDSLERLGVEEVGAAVEWATAGDGRVCPKCRPLDGIVLKLKEARGLLPRHPNCRCAWEPANVGEPDTRTTALGDDVKQKRSKSEIQKALDRSIAAELPKTKERTLDEQKKLTKWVGADTTVDTKRPKSILDDDYTGNFNPGQPRDSRGRWSSGGAGGTIDFDSFKEGRGDTTFAVLEATAKDLSDRWDVSDDDLMALAREEYSRPAEREWLASKTPGEVKEGLVLATLKKWTGSSGGPIASSVAVAASKKHGSTQELRLHPNEQSVLSYLEQRPAANRAIGSLSDAMYEGTQKWFADREIKEITVYRKGGLAEDRPFS
ncbi:MAG: phage minor head protein, partial [Pelagibacteraceae bacterium]